ncbi:hypothetical protein [Erwinia tasmaniensis]|nr:hypothetical protein [Erwinia tasmaniensis]
MEIDITPFPEYRSNHYLSIPCRGVVFSGEIYENSRCQSGVIESHHNTADWGVVLSSYKNWLSEKGKIFSFLFVLLNGELVHHEVNMLK